MIMSLKRGIRKRRSRLNRCARNLATFQDRLAAISMQMQSLQQRQWRRSAPQLCGLENTSTGSGVHLAGGTPCRPDWSVLTPFNLPRPGTPALCAYPLQMRVEMEMEIGMQSQHHSIVGYGYVPRTPVLRPVHVLRLADTLSLQPEANQCHAHVLGGPVEMDISPTDTVSPYDLDPPRGFPAIGHVDLADAVRGLCISQGQLGHVPVVHEPKAADHRGEVEVEVDLSLPRCLGMLGHESAGLRLQRLARKGERI
jgi:hypothetical protein